MAHADVSRWCRSASTYIKFNLISDSAEGLAVGLGIGTIAEVAKQSLGGKRRGGMLLSAGDLQ